MAFSAIQDSLTVFFFYATVIDCNAKLGSLALFIRNEIHHFYCTNIFGSVPSVFLVLLAKWLKVLCQKVFILACRSSGSASGDSSNPFVRTYLTMCRSCSDVCGYASHHRTDIVKLLLSIAAMMSSQHKNRCWRNKLGVNFLRKVFLVILGNVIRFGPIWLVKPVTLLLEFRRFRFDRMWNAQNTRGVNGCDKNGFLVENNYRASNETLNQ